MFIVLGTKEHHNRFKQVRTLSYVVLTHRQIAMTLFRLNIEPRTSNCQHQRRRTAVLQRQQEWSSSSCHNESCPFRSFGRFELFISSTDEQQSRMPMTKRSGDANPKECHERRPADHCRSHVYEEVFDWFEEMVSTICRSFPRQ